MKIRTIYTTLLSLSLAFVYGQNEKTNRNAFILELAVDEKQYYS